jgi:hypothetical protein
LEINTGKDYDFKFHFELIGNYCEFLKRFECKHWEPFLEPKYLNDFGLKCIQRLEYFSYEYIDWKKLRAFMPSTNKIKGSHVKDNPFYAKDFQN